MGYPDYRHAKAKAEQALVDAGVFTPPVDPVAIARGMGVGVKFVEFAGDAKNISGFYDVDDNTIYVNKDEFPLRQTFTIAHELGHKVMHSEWAKSEDYKVLMRNEEQPKNKYEYEANEFAANLLMPRELVDQYTNLSPRDLSRLFAVSVPAVEVRLKKLYG